MKAFLLAKWRGDISTSVVWGLALATFFVALITIQNFLVSGDLKITLSQVLVLAFAAAGETVVIIAGGIDVSVQGMISASAVLCGQLSNGHDSALPWVLPVIFGIAVVVGLTNGLGVVYFGVSPIMMTIATNVIVSGAASTLVGFGSLSTAPPALQKVADSSVLGIPISIIVLVLLTALMTFVLKATTLGRRIYAVGSSPLVSELSGIRSTPIIIASYVMSSIGAACAGLVLLAYLVFGTLGVGDPYLFTAIAAVAVGGVSLVGGTGNFTGVLGAVIFLTLLTLILTAQGLGTGALDLIYGVAILLCVGLATRRATSP